MPKMYVTILLDRSGSMETCRDNTISAINEYVNGLKYADTETYVSLILFDNISQEYLYTNLPAVLVPPLARQTFVPRGSTPLNDAIGKAVHDIDSRLPEFANDRVALVILTDGFENASKEYTKEAVKALLDYHQKERDWLVVYLGANQDATKVGQDYGMNFGNTMTYNTANVSSAMGSTLRATKSYGVTGQAAAASFTDDERKEAL